MRKAILPIIIALGLLILSGSMFIVDEAKQAIVIQFGKPVGEVITDAGLHFKIPIIQNVIKFDRRVLEWDGSANEIPTKDNKYIFIDSFARWKISDPLQFYKSSRNEMMAQSRLDDIIDGAVRDEISSRVMEEIIRSSDRNMMTYESEEESLGSESSEIVKPGARLDIINSIKDNVINKLAELNMGIEVIDVQLKRINYNEQVQSKLFNRMVSEQNMIAEKYRAQGQGNKQEIMGEQIKREKEIRSEAYLKAQKIRGAADAEAVRIFADTYGRAPEFYRFSKTLKTYEATLDSTTQIVLSTEGKYLKYLSK
jgi:membrane protease subunit HflC